MRKTATLAEMDVAPLKKGRAQAEETAHTALDLDARTRMKGYGTSSEEKAMIFRTSEDRKKRMIKVARILTAGRTKGRPVSLKDVFERSFDEFERKILGQSRAVQAEDDEIA